MTPHYFIERAWEALTANGPTSGADLIGICILANMLAYLTGEPPPLRPTVDCAIREGYVR